jgi:hypothetical protein
VNADWNDGFRAALRERSSSDSITNTLQRAEEVSCVSGRSRRNRALIRVHWQPVRCSPKGEGGLIRGWTSALPLRKPRILPAAEPVALQRL